MNGITLFSCSLHSLVRTSCKMTVCMTWQMSVLSNLAGLITPLMNLITLCGLLLFNTIYHVGNKARWTIVLMANCAPSTFPKVKHLLTPLKKKQCQSSCNLSTSRFLLSFYVKKGPEVAQSVTPTKGTWEVDDRGLGIKINEFPSGKAMHFSYLLWLSTIVTEGLDVINMLSIPAGSKWGSLTSFQEWAWVRFNIAADKNVQWKQNRYWQKVNLKDIYIFFQFQSRG